jgi:hypothetical protein
MSPNISVTVVRASREAMRNFLVSGKLTAPVRLLERAAPGAGGPRTFELRWGSGIEASIMPPVFNPG